MAQRRRGVPGHCVVLTACPSRNEAQRLASSILSLRLGACAQIDEVTSHYWWEGTLHHETEWRVMVKTRGALFDKLSAHICSNHSYSVPQVVAIPVVAGSKAYLAWIDEVTAVAGAAPRKRVERSAR